jgi:TonB family protein
MELFARLRNAGLAFFKMKLRFLLLIAPLAAIAISLFVLAAKAQTKETTSSATPEVGVVLVKLSPPIYPPLARQARITGDVSVQVSIRKDGSIESAEVISGHPMLKQAALDSARKSTFECRGCGDPLILYPMTYTFEILNDCRFGPNCEADEPRAPEVAQSQHKIKITVEPACTCDPAATRIRIRVRSPKCLYLWRCGFREAEDK